MEYKATHIVVRVSPQDKKLLREVCRKRGEDLSDFVRRAVRKELARLSYFDEETKKALGLNGGETKNG